LQAPWAQLCHVHSEGHKAGEHEVGKHDARDAAIQRRSRAAQDAMETASQSADPEIAEELLHFFVEQGQRECFAACLYTCYDLIKPDVAMEASASRLRCPPRPSPGPAGTRLRPQFRPCAAAGSARQQRACVCVRAAALALIRCFQQRV